MKPDNLYKAFLMVLLEVDQVGDLIVKGVRITNSDQLTCQLQKQTWARIQAINGASSYDEAREDMITYIDSVASLSREGSIWHVIKKMVNAK